VDRTAGSKLDKSNDAAGPLDAGDNVVYTVRVWNDGNVDRSECGRVGPPSRRHHLCRRRHVDAAATCAQQHPRLGRSRHPNHRRAARPGTAISLTYTVDLPATVDPGRAYTNTAGVRQYEASVNGADPRSSTSPPATSTRR
jgi:hypothetical protein